MQPFAGAGCGGSDWGVAMFSEWLGFMIAGPCVAGRSKQATIEKQCWERKFKNSMRQFDGKNVTQSHLFQKKTWNLGGYGFEISYSGTPAFHTFAQEMPLRLFVEGCMHCTVGPHPYPLGWVRFLKNAFGHFGDSALAWLPKRCHLAKATRIKIIGKVMGWVF